jgi:type VII secretion EsaA-like protein
MNKIKKYLLGKGLIILCLVMTVAILAYMAQSDKLSFVLGSKEKTHLRIGIVNQDEGSQLNNVSYNFGEDFTKLLAKDESGQASWKVMSRDQAESQYKDNSLEAIIYIPKDFSHNVLQLSSFNPEKAKITYKVKESVKKEQSLEMAQQVGEYVNSLNQETIRLYFTSVVNNLDDAKIQMNTIVGDESNIYNSLTTSIGYDKETTLLRSLEPMNYDFILLMDDTPSQTYSLERTLLSAFSAFSGKVNRVVVDTDGRFTGMNDYFDTIIEEVTTGQFLNELLGIIQSGMRREQPMFVYLPDINLTGDKIMLTDKDVNTLFTKSSAVNIHLIFHGYQSGIVTKFTPFFKRLRQNVPMGTFGTTFNEQKVVPGRTKYNEPLVELNETQLFIGRDVYRLRIPQDK